MEYLIASVIYHIFMLTQAGRVHLAQVRESHRGRQIVQGCVLVLLVHHTPGGRVRCSLGWHHHQGEGKVFEPRCHIQI
jgi:hypothetical protein